VGGGYYHDDYRYNSLTATTTTTTTTTFPLPELVCLMRVHHMPYEREHYDEREEGIEEEDLRDF